MIDCESKMRVLKNDYKVFLESKYKEGVLSQAHKNGLWTIVERARKISKDPIISSDEAKIRAAFDDEWEKSINDLAAGGKIDELKWTYCENLQKTFKGV